MTEEGGMVMRRLAKETAATRGSLGVLLLAVVGCGNDQRTFPGDLETQGDGDAVGDGDRGDGGSSGDGDGDSPGAGQLVLDQASHVPLPTERWPGASCGAEVEGVILAASTFSASSSSGLSLGDEMFITRTELPLNETVLSEVTDRHTWSPRQILECEAHLAGDRVFFLYTALEFDVRSRGGFSVDLEGRIRETDLGVAEAFWGQSEAQGAAGRNGQLGIVGCTASFGRELDFRLFDNGEEVADARATIANCDPSDVPPTVVATETGFAASFFCKNRDESGENQLITAFLRDGEMERFEIPLDDSLEPTQVGLSVHWDGSVIVAHGPLLAGAKTTDTANIYRVFPSAEFGYSGTLNEGTYDQFDTVSLENAGLELSARFNTVLVLLARRQRFGEDAPPQGYADYCFLDQTGLSFNDCSQVTGNNLHDFPSGLYAFEEESYAPTIVAHPWEGPTARRVLFDAGLDIPRALHCTQGSCEMVLESYPDGWSAYGPSGFAFFEIDNVLAGEATVVRSAPTSFPFSGSELGAPPTLVAWQGGPAAVLTAWNRSGPYLVEVSPDGERIVSAVSDLASFQDGPFADGDGYRLFGNGDEEAVSGRVDGAGTLSMEAAEVSRFHNLYKCGERYLEAHFSDLFVSTDEAVSEFEQLEVELFPSGQAIGCNGEFLLMWSPTSDPPLSLVDLVTSAVTPGPSLDPYETPQVSLMGDRVALFQIAGGELSLAVVDASGHTESYSLPLAAGVDIASTPPSGWADVLIVPASIPEDLSQVSLVWATAARAAVLSSWSFTQKED